MLYLILAATLVCLGTLAFYFLTRTKYLPEELVKQSCAKIQRTSKLEPNHSLMESHKILVAAVQQMSDGKKLTAAETLNKVAKRFDNVKELWKFHRMRNLAAHELDYEVSVEEAKEARKIFKQSLKRLVKG